MEGKFIGSRQAKIFHKSNRIYGLPQREVPGWLRDLAEAPDSYLNKKAPMEKILCDSLFYPGCGVDGRIVKYMSGYIHSFIYVDYTHSRSFILDRFFGSRTMENKHAGVTGYHCILEKDISRGEIAVAGWNPPCPPESTSLCGCQNDPDEEKPDVNICSVCTGQPGTLPVINKQAVKNVLKVGVALGAKLADFTEWDRKN